MDPLCEGCTSVTGRNIECTLKPKYKNKQCPCSTCIVKMVCTENHYTCNIYKGYCLYQLPNELKYKRAIPCEKCSTFDMCLNKVHEMGEKVDINIQYEYNSLLNVNLILESTAETFFYNTIALLQKECPIIKAYFPHNVLSNSNKDVRVGYPNSYKNQLITFVQWKARECLLWEKFECYEIIQKKNPFNESIFI